MVNQSRPAIIKWAPKNSIKKKGQMIKGQLIFKFQTMKTITNNPNIYGHRYKIHKLTSKYQNKPDVNPIHKNLS